jgi:protein-S-isoprenylcysteine O-methyltransferase Ste14
MRVAIILLGLSWLIFAVVWLLGARAAKPSRRSLPWGKQGAFMILLAIGGGLIVSRLAGWSVAGGPTSLEVTLWPSSTGLAVAAVILSYLGLAVAVWARVTLGRNWSAIPELKQGHELVTRGPYAAVRHPIYTGLLLMFAAVAALWATPAGLFLLLVVAVGIQLKLSREETLLAGEFPDQWPAYHARTKRVLPLIW